MPQKELLNVVGTSSSSRCLSGCCSDTVALPFSLVGCNGVSKGFMLGPWVCRRAPWKCGALGIRTCGLIMDFWTADSLKTPARTYIPSPHPALQGCEACGIQSPRSLPAVGQFRGPTNRQTKAEALHSEAQHAPNPHVDQQKFQAPTKARF